MDIKYFKVKYGFDETQYAEITSDELPKAYGMFLAQEGNGIFKDGTAIRAKDIIRIEPNWHKVRGWNRGWKMTLDDYEDIKPLERGYQDIQNQAKLIAERAIKENRTELLTKPMSELLGVFGISDKPNLPPDITKQICDISSKFKI